MMMIVSVVSPQSSVLTAVSSAHQADDEPLSGPQQETRGVVTCQPSPPSPVLGTKIFLDFF